METRELFMHILTGEGPWVIGPTLPEPGLKSWFQSRGSETVWRRLLERVGLTKIWEGIGLALNRKTNISVSEYKDSFYKFMFINCRDCEGLCMIWATYEVSVANSCSRDYLDTFRNVAVSTRPQENVGKSRFRLEHESQCLSAAYFTLVH